MGKIIIKKFNICKIIEKNTQKKRNNLWENFFMNIQREIIFMLV